MINEINNGKLSVLSDANRPTKSENKFISMPLNIPQIRNLVLFIFAETMPPIKDVMISIMALREGMSLMGSSAE